jgi:hypothetical protein
MLSSLYPRAHPIIPGDDRADTSPTTGSIHSLPNLHVNTVDGMGNTLLHLAVEEVRCRRVRLRAVQLLLEHPFIVINHRNIDGKLPIDIVKETLSTCCWSISGDREDKERIIALLENFLIQRRMLAYKYFMSNTVVRG